MLHLAAEVAEEGPGDSVGVEEEPNSPLLRRLGAQCRVPVAQVVLCQTGGKVHSFRYPSYRFEEKTVARLHDEGRFLMLSVLHHKHRSACPEE